MQYAIGTTVRFSCEMRDRAAGGAYYDPTTVRLKLKPPGGSTTTYVYGVAAEILRSATGRYTGDVTLAVAGTWRWRWEAEGPVAGALEGIAVVAASTV